MSDERTQEFEEEDFSREEEEEEEEEELETGDSGEETEESGEDDDELGSENEVREGEEFVAENVTGEEEESFPMENDRETTSLSSSNKRLKEMSIDRLSALPDSILIRILSLLEMPEAINTSVLSKRWQFLWPELPRLQFLDNKDYSEEKIRKFVTRVHSALAIRSGNNLEKFEVSFSYSKCFASDINVWVDFVVKNKVKKVVLELTSWAELYILPQMMYSNSALTWLSLEGCIVAPPRTVTWENLTGLALDKVEISEHAIEKILSGCPVLSFLGLMKCRGFNRLEINSQSVHTLRVDDFKEDASKPLLEISAPYARFLEFWQYPKGKQIRLTNIPYLGTAIFNFNGCDWDSSSVEVMSYTKDLIEDLQHVKKLELGGRCIKVLSVMAVNGWQLPQSRRKHLIIEARRDEESISGIFALLESSPNLETLFIKNSVSFGESVKTWCSPARGDLDCDLLHLKHIHIMNFAARKLSGEPLLTLAPILLKRATGLEKMVIQEYKFSSSSYFMKIAQTLLSYPRSSQKAAVILR